MQESRESSPEADSTKPSTQDKDDSSSPIPSNDSSPTSSDKSSPKSQNDLSGLQPAESYGLRRSRKQREPIVKDLGTPRANGRRHRSASADKEDTAAAKKAAKEEKAEMKRLMQSRDKLQEQEIKRIKKRFDKDLNSVMDETKRAKLERDSAVTTSEKWKTMYDELKASTTASVKMSQKELSDSKTQCRKLMQDISKLEKALIQLQSSVTKH